MNKVICIILCLIHTVCTFSQTGKYPIIDAGDKALKNKQYQEALNKYDAAEADDPDNLEIKALTKKKRKEVFDKIASEAGSSKNQIKKLLDTIQDQKEKIKTSLDLSTINIAKSQKYINGLNLTKGNLAIVFNVPKGGSNPQYGFINKNGDVVIDYKYDDAAPFDYTGFARVKRINLSGSGKKKWEETTYLINTAGKEYPSAHITGDLKPAITAIDLRDTVLEEFPTTIFSHPQLKVLLLQGDLQTVITIPAEIQKMKSLECFSSLSYVFDSIPSEIGQLSNLKSLIISYGNLKNLPGGIVKLEKLQSLDLSGNSMTSFPVGIFSLSQLQSLNLASNSLERIPEQIGNLVKLQNLDLQWNKLKSLPAQIGELRNLQSLNLDKNLLETLPTEIGRLTNLNELVLSGNQFRNFPIQVLMLTNLEFLDLSSNRSLKIIPPEISRLTNLRTLKLINTSIPDSEQQRIKNLLPWCYIIFKEQK